METIDETQHKKKLLSLKEKLQTDVVIQSILLGICLLGILTQSFGLGFISFYFLLGGYQLISSLSHLAYKNHSVRRKLYWPQLIIHVFTFGSLLIVEEPIDVLLVTLFTTGFSAFYYYILTLIEYANLRK